ncbi:MAG: hypothetical protein M5U09_10645 [Gammaproteobacteria bacterium]|nr:hypothetical protein [Gammaproteobacteria bacterium]
MSMLPRDVDAQHQAAAADLDAIQLTEPLGPRRRRDQQRPAGDGDRNAPTAPAR